MSKFHLEGSSALITGASAGIGREFARQLAGRAGSLVLVARRQERLEELRDELSKRDPNPNVHIRVTDLSDDRAVIELCDWLEREKLSIDLLINNAGLGDMGPFATSELQRVKEMLAVNITALTLLTRLLLPGMIARKRGAILNVSSSAGFLPIAGFAVYAATKAYVTSFAEAIRAELHGTSVTVTSLCPGPVHTEFTEVAHRSSAVREKSGPEFTHVSVEAVVRETLDALERDKPLVIPGFVMKLAMLLVRLTPLPVLRLASRFSAKK
jgi:short-subunit dehydrogenase